MNNQGRLHGLDLFSGIGGNTLALRDYIRTIAYCEFERHAQSVLLSRMQDGSIEPAPIWDDVRTLTAANFATPIDIIVGGFPCQDISVAGAGAGITKETRSGLFFEIMRLVRELRPTFVFLENVPAIRTRGLNIVLRELTEAGYDCRWTMLSAASVGALHKRERWFLLAKSTSEGFQGQLWQSGNSNSSDRETQSQGREQANSFTGCSDAVSLSDVANTHGQRLPLGRQTGVAESLNERTLAQLERRSCSRWPVEPSVGRVANGVPLRVDRIKRLGNSVVPAQARAAFEMLAGLK